MPNFLARLNGWLFSSKPAAQQGALDFHFLAENAGDVILLVGIDHKARYVSPAAFTILGWKPEEMVGQGPEKFIHPDDLPSLMAARDRKLAGDTSPGTEVLRFIRKDGGIVWVESNARPAMEPGTNRPAGIVLTLRDVTDRHRREQELASLAMTDGLTGLANRRAFDEALGQEWARTIRDGSQMSLLLIDVDHFKAFNDHYGHQVGDDCLRAIAATILAVTRHGGDVGARYGGEELAVILANAALDGASAYAERLREAVEALAIPHAGNPEGNGIVTVSIGAATALRRLGGTMRMPESLIGAADMALYKSKRNGRNRVTSTMVLAPDNSQNDT